MLQKVQLNFWQPKPDEPAKKQQEQQTKVTGIIHTYFLHPVRGRKRWTRINPSILPCSRDNMEAFGQLCPPGFRVWLREGPGLGIKVKTGLPALLHHYWVGTREVLRIWWAWKLLLSRTSGTLFPLTHWGGVRPPPSDSWPSSSWASSPGAFWPERWLTLGRLATRS